jgi:hypothetical protein
MLAELGCFYVIDLCMHAPSCLKKRYAMKESGHELTKVENG